MKRLEINNRRYLGSKYKLLSYLDEIIEENHIEFKSFLDIFAGTGVVADHYAKQGKTVYVNDILLSNYYAYVAWFDSETISKRKLNTMIGILNQQKVEEENYFSTHFADTYFSHSDCRKIGYIREYIEQQYTAGNLNQRERAYMITSLIYSMDRIANTVGHYDAYRKTTEIRDRFVLYGLEVETSPSKKNKVFHKNANDLITEIKADVLFVDMPYNSRQYSDAYHILENVAEWKKPSVYGVARKMNRNHLKSDYCMKKAGKAFQHLVEHAECNYIIVTYNNMGKKGDERSQAKISDTEMIEILEGKGEVFLYEKRFSYYTAGKTALEEHLERIFVCKVDKKRKYNRKETRPIRVTEDKRFVKSPLNYMGGKYKLMPQYMKYFPKEITHFVDCCCGGCNVAINVPAQKTTCIDNNPYIIQIFQLFQKYSYMEVITRIEELITSYGLSDTLKYSYAHYKCSSSGGVGTYNKEPYYKLRAAYNERLEQDDQKTFMLLTLIFYSFNHQIRFNSSGEFNMPVGKRDFNGSIRKNLLAFMDRMNQKQMNFVHEDFREINVNEYDETSFFYIDPPYLIAGASYNEANGWEEQDERDLLAKIDEINAKGISFALSNVTEHNNKKNTILLDWIQKNNFYIKELKNHYNNSNYQINSRETKTVEVLIMNYNSHKIVKKEK